jgi:hypothetical protein
MSVISTGFVREWVERYNLITLNTGLLITSGALSGIAIYQDRTCTDSTANNSLTGGSTQNIVGAIYFPGEKVSYSGGSPSGGAVCTQLIAWKIDFSGGSTFNNTCAGTGTRSTSLTGGRLVE